MGLTGGCLCGKIRYTVEGDSMHALKCHCRDCQRISGSGYLPILWFRANQVKLNKGELRFYSRTSDRGSTVQHGFCGVCSTPVLLEPSFDGMDIVFLVAGTLDDPSIFSPKADLWVDSAQHWDCLDESIDQVPTQRTGRMAE